MKQFVGQEWQFFPRDDNLPCLPVKNVIFILLYWMSHFYNKFHRPETLPCDIQNCQLVNRPIRLLEFNMRCNNQNCHPANWPITLLEINMRYNKTKCVWETLFPCDNKVQMILTCWPVELKHHSAHWCFYHLYYQCNKFEVYEVKCLQLLIPQSWHHYNNPLTLQPTCEKQHFLPSLKKGIQLDS